MARPDAARYKHGGDVYGAKRYLNCELSELLDYSANINPLVSVEWIKERLTPYWERVLHYPDPENLELMEAISDIHGVAPSQIVLGNGATPLIHQLVQALMPDVARLSAPTFGEYQCALDKLAIPVSYAKCDEKTLQVSLEDLANIDLSPGQRGLVFLCNPNNPTGQRFEVGEVLKLLERLPVGCYLVVDEAFVEFTLAGEVNSLSPYIAKFSNLLVLRSATKFYGMPGLRLGYLLVGDAALANDMRAEMPIWQVNVLAAGLFLSSFRDSDFREKTIAAICDERLALQNDLKAHGFRVWPSDANYFIVLPPAYNGDLGLDLLERGILIRNCDNYLGLGNGYYRIAVKTAENRMRFTQTLHEIGINRINIIEKQ